MSEAILKQVYDCGQSIWLDHISRSLIDKGKLRHFVASGLRGMTSNPTIFDNAVSKSNDYDSHIRKLKAENKKAFEIYDEITVRDIQDAADAFATVYRETGGLDGYVSLEINPELADDTDATVAEGRRLHRKVNRPNIMFKVPATEAGFPAIEALLSESINVNVTLVFSVEQYLRTTDAYLRGLEVLAENRESLRSVRSVASVFVSRIDTVVDKLIEEKTERMAEPALEADIRRMRGRAAVANAVIIYDKFQKIFSAERFQRLQEKGCYRQRVLWGSTSTKNPSYSDIKYVDELIGRDTINTIPQDTLEAFMDHGSARASLPGDVEQASVLFERLRKIGIDIDEVCEKLLRDGVIAFQKSFDSLLRAIEQKAAAL